MVDIQGIAKGFVEGGIDLIITAKRELSFHVVKSINEDIQVSENTIPIEYSFNDKSAFEIAFGAASEGHKTACLIQQSEFNTLLGSLMKALERPLHGPCVVVVCDNNRPVLPNIKRRIKLLSAMLGIPLLELATLKDAPRMGRFALTYALEQEKPVILIISPLVEKFSLLGSTVTTDMNNFGYEDRRHMGTGNTLGIVASGPWITPVCEVVSRKGIQDQIRIYNVTKIYPVDPDLVKFASGYENLLIFEDDERIIDFLMRKQKKVFNIMNHQFPINSKNTGTMSLAVVDEMITEALSVLGVEEKRDGIKTVVSQSDSKESNEHHSYTRDCAQCPYEEMLITMKHEVSQGLFVSDVRCDLEDKIHVTSDTDDVVCLDISYVAGFCNVFNTQYGNKPQIIYIGTSVHLYKSFSGLFDFVNNRKSFVSVIIDNFKGNSIKIEEVLKGLKVNFIRTIDLSNIPAAVSMMKDAISFVHNKDAGPAVLVCRLKSNSDQITCFINED